MFIFFISFSRYPAIRPDNPDIRLSGRIAENVPDGPDIRHKVVGTTLLPFRKNTIGPE